MSLATAMGISTKALGLAQDGITTASNNLANINTPGYVKQTDVQESVVINGVGQGAQLSGITTRVDAELYKSMRNQISSLGETGALNSYFDNIQRLYGQPNSGTGLSASIDAFFSAYQSLSNNPEMPSLRVLALTAAKDLANAISSTANSLQDMRFTADKEINSDVDKINSLLDSIRTLNVEILNFKENTAGYINIKQQVDGKLQELSEYLNISTSVDSNGKISVATANGVSLIDEATNVHLDYDATASSDAFKQDMVINAIKVKYINSDGTLSNDSSATELTSSGQSSTITTNITSGAIKGLLSLRDNIIPDLLSQLDSLASAITNEANAINNNGYAFPPPKSLTGTTAVASDTEVAFSGKVMVAVLKNDGTPIPSQYSDEDYIRPLTLNLGTLSGATVSGRPTMQDIVNQINDYYGPVQNRAVVGNLRNIQLSAVSDSIGNNTGTAKFDLKLDNTSAEDATVVVQSVTLINPNNPLTTYGPGTSVPSPTNSFTIKAGEMGSTGQPITVDFSGGVDLNNYTIRVRVQVTDSSGNVSVSDVDYSVNDNVTNIKNNPYNAIAVAPVSGTSQFVPSPGGPAVAKASLVDANGNDVASGQTGFLKITTTGGNDYRLAIDELDSKELGISGSGEEPTDRGFSHYFGLNNLFVDNGTLKGSAQNMAVRSDIQKDANLLSSGTLFLSNQPSDTTKALYTYEANSGNNYAALNMAKLNQKNVFFPAAGNLPSVSITFNGYSSDIVGSVAASALQATSENDAKQTGMDGLQVLFQKTAGVNSDEELARIIQLQNNFAASAKVISVVQRLYDILAQTVQ